MINIKKVFAEVQHDRNYALVEAKRNCGKGCYQSRGAWIIVVDKMKPEPICSAGEWEFKPTKAVTLKLQEYLSAGHEVYVEGGFNYGESVRDFEYGTYEPYVSEWSVRVEM